MPARLCAALLLACAVASLPMVSLAQEAPQTAAPASPTVSQQPVIQTPVFQSPVLTIHQQRLFEESDFGRYSLDRLEAESRDLQAEIRKIESDLEIEERLLTERRANLAPDDFLPLAKAFDDKVEKIRAAWGAKDRDLKRQRDLDQQKFFEAAVPILAELMQDMGAIMLIDQSSVILSLDRVDITQTAIDRINARLAKAPTAAPNQQAAPRSGQTPEATPPAENTPQKP